MPPAFIVALALLLHGVPAVAEPVVAADILLEVTLERTSVRLGDPVALRLVVTHPAQTNLAFPDVAALQSTGLEVLRVLPGQDSRAFADSLTTVLEYPIVGFAPQVHVLAPAVLAVGYETQDGQRGMVQPPDPVILTVASVLADVENPTLRGIRPPVALPEPFTALSPAVPVALLATAVVLLVIYARNGRRQRPLSLAATPEQRAREALQAAAASLSGPRPDYVLFHCQVDGATRKYLAERTDLPTLTATTRELQRYVAQNGTERQQADLLLNVLKACDGARWAHEYSGLAAAHETLGLAFQLIDSIASNGHHNGLATAGPRPGRETSA